MNRVEVHCVHVANAVHKVTYVYTRKYGIIMCLHDIVYTFGLHDTL